jgi:hypothetical protein
VVPNSRFLRNESELQCRILYMHRRAAVHTTAMQRDCHSGFGVRIPHERFQCFPHTSHQHSKLAANAQSKWPAPPTTVSSANVIATTCVGTWLLGRYYAVGAQQSIRAKNPKSQNPKSHASENNQRKVGNPTKVLGNIEHCPYRPSLHIRWAKKDSRSYIPWQRLVEEVGRDSH